MRIHRLLPIPLLVLAAGCAGTDRRPAPSTPPATAATAPPPAGRILSSLPASWTLGGTATAADGVPVHYTARGSGQPALVFVHCWTCDRGFWDSTMSHFAPRHAVVALDLAGHGESGRRRQEWTIPAFAADVRKVVEKLGLEPVVLIGHSLGGPIVLEAARAMPERVAGVVLVDTVLDPEERQDPAAVEQILAAFRADYPGTTAKFMKEYLFAPSTDPGLIERLVAKSSAHDPAIAIGIIAAAWSYDPRPALAEIRVPIRAVNADRSPTNLEAWQRHHPGFAASIMPGVGHYPMLEDPARFNEQLAGALAELAAAER